MRSYHVWALQIETAKALGINTVIMAAVRSVGASVGCSDVLTTVLLGSTTVGMNDRESAVMSWRISYLVKRKWGCLNKKTEAIFFALK